MEVCDSYKRLVDQGWTDALRHLNPGKRVYTFWKHRRGSFERDAGLRIDQVLLSPQVAKSLKNAGVDRNVRAWVHTSDHAPVWVEFG